ncbi:MAG: hypothetical protein PHQ74_09560 [Crocinitomicaceae bacterium]|nr:hypothetical protein [Crocinitomicaceae bacterium]
MEKHKYHRFETYFFILIIGLNLAPVFTGQFFPTLDGPAHLYNSQIINTLIADSQSPLQDFFAFNPEPVPNWTGHLFLSFFKLFLPAFVAEKMMLLIYLVGLPLTFRALVKTISPNNHALASYLIFPFTYSFVFFLGFYNFSLAILFLFIAITYWLKIEDQKASIKNTSILVLLIALTYFSHILVFAILLLLIGLQITFKAINQLLNEEKTFQEIFLKSIKKAGFVIGSAIIPLILFIQYFLARPSIGDDTFIPREVLIKGLQNIQSIIAFDASQEESYTKLIFKVLAFLVIIALYKRIREIEFNTPFFSKYNYLSMFRSILSASSFWMISFIIILFLYFKLPDSDGSAGFVSVRLSLLFFLLLITWLSTQKFSSWFSILFVSVVLFSTFKLNVYYTQTVKHLSSIALACNQVSKHVEANSIVLPLNFTDNWLLQHYSNYLGIDKPMIILENYECATGYFPINWNHQSLPNTKFGAMVWNDVPCIEWFSNTENQEKQIDYVFVLGDLNSKIDTCNLKVKQNLNTHYTQTYRSEHCLLYKRKQ